MKCGDAIFERDGNVLWQCNADAELRFALEQVGSAVLSVSTVNAGNTLRHALF